MYLYRATGYISTVAALGDDKAEGSAQRNLKHSVLKLLISRSNLKVLLFSELYLITTTSTRRFSEKTTLHTVLQCNWIHNHISHLTILKPRERTFEINYGIRENTNLHTRNKYKQVPLCTNLFLRTVQCYLRIVTLMLLLCLIVSFSQILTNIFFGDEISKWYE